ncbi:polysaccharide deacetylase family protein [Riemerella columbina]|uniref:polysaccharide deacetylase family protein n=1 Tax=Riemerella columbina TaxID=103810 RepID=UPI00266EBE1C|nr:polysaccharide deacetylase family protein [Riemerella columbina]WKS94706.1 polysaccharide deacetylase family protein [Riemerella columbina]
MILLSFDIEEFDMPLEYQGNIPFEEQIAVSTQGLERILDLLKKHQVKATFFSTVVFAEHAQPLVERLLAEGHELASHTWYHSVFQEEDLKTSRERLQSLFNTEVRGLRMPRMSPVREQAVAEAGYHYNSSINPTFLPGRYNNLKVPRTYFQQSGVWQVPASVSYFRVPLFWLSFHNFPQVLYQGLCRYALKKDGYLNLYFHPWEFVDIQKPQYRLPAYTTKNTGDAMVERFDQLIRYFKKQNKTFGTFTEFLKDKK